MTTASASGAAASERVGPPKLYAVMVAYGEADARLAARRFRAATSNLSLELVLVDTSVPFDQNCGRSVNEAFEFSGYQCGMKTVCSLVEARGSVSSKDEMIRVLVLNSTAFTAHSDIATRVFLRKLLAVSSEYARQAVVGVRWEAEGPIRQVAASGWYFATHMFVMIGTVADLKCFRFYDASQVARFARGEFQDLADDYNEAVMAWLSPKSMLAGWYKASPYAALARSEVIRKRTAIFLEHSLPTRLSGAGFLCVASNVHVPLRERWVLRFVMLVDRVYVNMLKVRYRGRVVADRILRKFPRND